MALSFDALPEIALLRELVRRWWGLELGLADGKGAGYARTSHAACDTVRGVAAPACAAAMADIAAGFASGAKGAVIKRCHAGLIIVAAPVYSYVGGKFELAGIVHASGGRSGATELQQVIGCSAEEAAELEMRATNLDDRDLSRLSDLVLEAAAAVDRTQPADIPPTTWQHKYTEIVGDAPAVREVVKLLDKVVKSEATVLVHGESGTGKELIARAIHYHGPRAKQAFIVQNCSAFNDNLLESALFGHVRGAFTGAVKDQKGLFEVADKGTFFLDEIGDMSAALQVKLLRVLQEGTFMPVGGTKPVKVDVRIVAASHKDLATMVAHKQFREDLFYRVNVLKLTVPPLRERVSDIPRLAQHFVTKHWHATRPPPRLSQSALARLMAYPWPGNIRELENEMERMLVLAGDAQELTASMVSPRVAGASMASMASPRTLRDSLATAEADAFVAALGRHAGDRDAAASDLGVSRGYLDARASILGL